RLEEAIKPYQHATVREHDLLWFSRALTKSSLGERKCSLSLVEDQYYGRTDGFAKGLIGTVRGDEIVNLIRDPHFPHEVDATLFEENIRVYLGEHNDINRKILNTAISNENIEFWYLNNGITITCDRMTYQPRSSSPKLEMVNPQIVNGGQTSHALFEAARSDVFRISDVKLIVRVIETGDRVFTNRVAEATNSQTPIRSRDIRSNDNIQIKIENSLLSEGYFYERKNDQHIDQLSSYRIDAVKLGQVILSCVLREPDKAKTSSNKIFGEYYHWIFDEGILSLENIVCIWKIYRLVDDDRRRALAMMNSRVAQDYDEAWLVEGVFHLLYMLSLRCESEGEDIFNFDAATRHYEAVKTQVDDFIAQNPGRAAYRVFRSSVTKRLLAQFSHSRQMELPLDPKSDTKGQ
ncbi:AIPR family protein, partial [Nostoc linckia]|uniref:AIPR family protein n=1 Tax=Nostoc linckia TaxID=92942 RepID=UPI001180DC58